MIKDLKIEDFLNVLDSKEPVPGGGSAAALVGAIGMSLGNMVGNLTIGKKAYARDEAEIKDIMEKADKIERDLVALIDKDAEAFKPLARAYSLPANTEEEKISKDEIMESSLKIAAESPLELMRVCSQAIDLFQVLANKGSKLALSDAGVGVLFCKAALKGAALNVFINTKLMKNREFAENMNSETDELLTIYSKKADEIYEGVYQRLK